MTRKREKDSWYYEKLYLKDSWPDEDKAKERLHRMIRFVYRNPRVLDE